MTTDKAGFPVICCLCGRRLVKSKDGPHRFYRDDVSGCAVSFHAGCGTLQDALEKGGSVGVA